MSNPIEQEKPKGLTTRITEYMERLHRSDAGLMYVYMGVAFLVQAMIRGGIGLLQLCGVLP